MSLEINANNPIMQSTDTSAALKTANLAKSQTELEGQMELQKKPAYIQRAGLGSPAYLVACFAGPSLNKRYK